MCQRSYPTHINQQALSLMSDGGQVFGKHNGVLFSGIKLPNLYMLQVQFHTFPAHSLKFSVASSCPCACQFLNFPICISLLDVFKPSSIMVMSFRVTVHGNF